MCDSRRNNNCEFIEYAMMNFLNPSARLELKISSFPWNSVPEYLEKHLRDIFKSYDYGIESFRIIFVEALKNHPCENRAIFTAITDIYTVISLQDRDYSDIFGYRKQGQLEMILSHLKQGDGQSIFPDQECIPIVEVLNGGRERFMQVLATHGCYADLSDDSFFARRQASVTIGRFLRVIVENGFLSPFISRRRFRHYFRNLEDDDLLYSFPNREYAAVVAYLDFLRSSLEPNQTPNSPLIRFFLDPSAIPEGFSVKRLFLVSLGINILSLNLEGYRPPPPKYRDYLSESIKTLEIYFRTITEPYLNVSEVRKLLTGCILHESKRHLLDQWCKVFEDVIPFCTKNYEPRKLSHLCRCQVRQNCYGSGSTLPSVIDTLNIPKAVKDFLLCKPLTKKLCTF